MKRHPSTILILLVSACIAATSAQANASTSSKSKNHLAYHSKAKQSIAASEVSKAIAAAKLQEPVGTIRFKDSSSLYDARNTEYLPKQKDSAFDFGPKSANFKYDKRMIMAAQIAAERAHKHSTSRCWMYVKNALVSANLVSSRPTTEYAKQAGDELQHKYGFQKLAIRDPFAAPLGSVLVYGGRGAGHVEFRTSKGFVSDFTTDHPSRRPLIGVYVKPS